MSRESATKKCVKLIVGHENHSLETLSAKSGGHSLASIVLVPYYLAATNSISLSTYSVEMAFKLCFWWHKHVYKLHLISIVSLHKCKSRSHTKEDQEKGRYIASSSSSPSPLLPLPIRLARARIGLLCSFVVGRFEFCLLANHTFCCWQFYNSYFVRTSKLHTYTTP